MGGEVSEKQKKFSDQRAPVTRYYLIKGPRSLDMKYYLVTGGLSSIAKQYTIIIRRRDHLETSHIKHNILYSEKGI